MESDVIILLGSRDGLTWRLVIAMFRRSRALKMAGRARCFPSGDKWTARGASRNAAAMINDFGISKACRSAAFQRQHGINHCPNKSISRSAAITRQTRRPTCPGHRDLRCIRPEPAPASAPTPRGRHLGHRNCTLCAFLSCLGTSPPPPLRTRWNHRKLQLPNICFPSNLSRRSDYNISLCI